MGTNDYQKGPRHGASRSGSTGKRSSGASRPRREPLQDNYYYEAPPRGWKEGDAFQDISSYSSPAKRRADQKAMEEQRRSTQRSGGRRPQKSGSQDIYSNSRPVKKSRPKRWGVGKTIVALVLVLVIAVGGSVAYMLSGLTMTSIPKSDSALGIQAGAMSDSQITNIALFGLDSREDGNTGRSDVVMVLSVDRRHHALKLTSILRDS